MQNIDNITLTQDQEELIDNLEEFIKDNRCYFGVYGPAGSGKSFTIGYFINKHVLYDKVLLSGTTNNACRVLEQSLDNSNEKYPIYLFIKNINIFISEMNLNIELLNKDINFIKNKDEVISYLNMLKTFATQLRKNTFNLLKDDVYDYDNFVSDDIKQSINDRNNILKNLNNEQMKEIKKEIHTFINENCNLNIKDKLYIKHINNTLENIFNKNKYIKTIHSLLSFKQSRDENHNITFLPSKSNIKEEKTKNGLKYIFTPKLTGKRKIAYDNMNQEEKIIFDKEFYENNFEKLKNAELLIVDESSMMKEIEFRYIIYICKILKLKIIFLGDKYQLPPVDDDVNKNEQETIDTNVNIDYSPAVKLKSSYTLSTIKRTSNPVLQEIYKTFRDLVERSGQGKIKIQNIQYTKNINPTDKYLIKNNNEIRNIIDYVKIYDDKLENTRILCFSNKEVNKMNNIMRSYLYGENDNSYVENETLLVTNYMLLPKFNSRQLILIENSLDNKNKIYFNLIYNMLTGTSISSIKKTDEINDIISEFNDINYKENKLRLYTSCSIKIIKIIDTQINVKEKFLNISVVFFTYESSISLFFYCKNKKENEHIKNLLKLDKQLIKLNTDMYRLHKCNENCDSQLKKHICNECVNSDMCVHSIQTCDKNSCTLVCNSCYECNPDCIECVKQHKNEYSTGLWDKFITKEYLLEPNVNYSYATTVHKSQGQSIENIIVAEYNIANCVLYNNEVSLKQKLLTYPTCMYTAVTRAKNILVRLK